MKQESLENHSRAKNITSRVLQLGQLSMDFARVRRVPVYADGERESDVEHSYMLAMIAAPLAVELYPRLDDRLVSQFALVHDLPEVITGDIPTLGISDVDRAKKEADEAVATEQLVEVLPEPWSGLLNRYEKQIEPEARFVRLVDKVMPLIVNINGDGYASLARYGITTADQIKYAERRANLTLRKKYPEFPMILDLHEELITQRKSVVFGE